jgi:hypothetical protein
MTEQLVTPAVVDNVQVVELRDPPVVPGVRVKVTEPVGAFVEVVVSTTVATTLAEQLLPPNAILQLTASTEVDVLSFPVAVTVTVAELLVLVLWVASPPYEAVTEPEPAAVPVNMTEQLPAESVQVVALNEPPVVPAVNVKVTIPVGTCDAVVESTTVAVTEAVQLDPPKAMLQVTLGTEVEVLSFAVVDTVIDAEGLVLPL